MEITKERLKKIEKYLPKPRGNFKIDKNAILYVMENGCKWRALPKHYGSWHTVYEPLEQKWSIGTGVFAGLQTEGIIKIKYKFCY